MNEITVPLYSGLIVAVLIYALNRFFEREK